MNKNNQYIISNIIALIISIIVVVWVFISFRTDSIIGMIFLLLLLGIMLYLFLQFSLRKLMVLIQNSSIDAPGKPIYRLHKLPVQEYEAAGGKARALAILYQEGFPVPNGIVLLPSAFSNKQINQSSKDMLLKEIDHLRKGSKNNKFAVRSSALSEDSAQASFAGEFESILNVSSNEEILDAIQKVRKSLYSERVKSYMEAQSISNRKQEIAVIIQEQIDPDFAGVLFTIDPMTGKMDHMQGNFVKGLGEKLVSGEVSAEIFSMQRPGGVYSGPETMRQAAKQLYKHAFDIEKFFSFPQDIEWAVRNNKVFILQSRPITTLNNFNPVSGEWNDSKLGHFLWSATNLSEAYPYPQTTFSASVRPYLEKNGGPNLIVKWYPLNGTIAGRFYSNLSVQISAFAPMFGGDPRKTYEIMAGWWGAIPEEVDIPLIPLEKGEWIRNVLPGLMKSSIAMNKYRKQIPVYLAENRIHCQKIKEKISASSNKQQLATIWEVQIKTLFIQTINILVSASSDKQIQTEKELKKWASDDDVIALLSNFAGEHGSLESLGPLYGLQKVSEGKITREEYINQYGHRGENEAEIAWPRPMEDPQWLEKQIAQFEASNYDVEMALQRQYSAYQAAWNRLIEAQPKQEKRFAKLLADTAKAAQTREAIRSESVRGNDVLRTFALKAAELTGLGENIFHLTIDETLALLDGDDNALAYIPKRKETYQQYYSYPAYPVFICGRFDPDHWISDPKRRIDLFNADSEEIELIPEDETIITGFAGSLGIVEGRVRKLEHLQDSDRLQAGEILLTSLTNIGWTPVFSRAAAIITDLGAPLSHAAIVARELGIPAVVGTGNATGRIKNGARVRVNGGKGIVEILE